VAETPIFTGTPSSVVDGIPCYFGEEAVNWDSSLEDLHADSTENHFMDVLTRTAVFDAIRRNAPRVDRILEVGCSSGLMLAELHEQWPNAHLAGLDALADGLVTAHQRVPDAEIAHASATDLPVADSSVDVVITINVLEHVADDATAFREASRVLRPGGVLVGVIPNNPALYDYYDAHLSHERRYRRGEPGMLASRAGLDPVEERYLGQYVYPPFWAVKKRNRRIGDRMTEAERAARVEADVTKTGDSRLGTATAKLEAALLRRGVGLPFGIRQMVVARKP
jgi:ubiquinone/menaquinone biosynthesis C-methylase UbiE